MSVVGRDALNYVSDDSHHEKEKQQADATSPLLKEVLLYFFLLDRIQVDEVDQTLLGRQLFFLSFNFPVEFFHGLTFVIKITMRV